MLGGPGLLTDTGPGGFGSVVRSNRCGVSDSSDQSSEGLRGGPSKPEVFGQLLARCQRQVFLYAMSLLHNAADAEEVLQETNLVLWRKFDQYQTNSDFATWACGIAYFEVLKLREKKAKDQRLLSDAFLQNLARQVEARSGLMDARREALQKCLDKLSRADRELLASRYQPQADTRTVAETLGRSVQGTRKALHRIRTALLGCIERTIAREEPT